MSITIITGSAGLIGSACAKYFAKHGHDIVGIDNDMRAYFFGNIASTKATQQYLNSVLRSYIHKDCDIRDIASLQSIFDYYGNSIAAVIHTAAQPSHDWAAREPVTDFTINAQGTLNLLESTRKYCPEAVFIYTSTNKVYGDRPNSLPLIETPTRWEIDSNHRFYQGIDETMPIDQSTHSLFGVSKLAGDLLVQEYGRYFGLKTAAFRGGCLTGPHHAGAELHGFLAYLMKCAVTGQAYTIFGYKGKQVRDNIHAQDIAAAFYTFFQNPRCGEVYNIGGGRFANCSILEAIRLCEEITGQKMNFSYSDQNRIGDHIWWVSNTTKFQSHYPKWMPTANIQNILQDIYDSNHKQWLIEGTK